MLTGLRVQNFKAFEDTNRLDLKPLTLLAGINSAGKSSILQALLLLKQTLESSPAQVLNPGGPLFWGTLDNFLFRGANEEEKDSTLTYNLAFGYAQNDALLDTLRAAALPGLSNDDLGEMLACNLRIVFRWGTFGYSERRTFHVDDLEISLKLGARPLMGLDVCPGEREGTYKACVVNEDTAPELRNLAFDQLRVDSLKHFLPESFIVAQPPKPDPLRDVSPRLAQFLRQLFQHIEADLAEKLYYLSSFREPPRPSYSNFSTPGLLSSHGGNFPQVLWQHRDTRVRFDHPGLSYSDTNRPSEMPLNDVVAWVLRDLLGLEQSVAVQSVEGREDILEVRVETLGEKKRPVTLADVGLGYNQILPVVVQGLLTPPGGLVIFEQPEIHLHPDVQAKLVPFFVGLVRAGRRVLVETHSSHMIEHVCLEIAQDRSNWLAENVQTLFVHAPDADHAGAWIEPVAITPYGEILNWPPHFLPDVAALDEAILKAGFAKRREEKHE